MRRALPRSGLPDHQGILLGFLRSQEEISWLLGLLGVVVTAGNGNEGEKSEGVPEVVEDEGKAVSKKELHQDLKKGTKRKNHAGDEDLGGEEEQGVHQGHKYMTFEEYLQVRKFIFLQKKSVAQWTL